MRRRCRGQFVEYLGVLAVGSESRAAGMCLGRRGDDRVKSVVVDSLVVIVHRDRQHLLGMILPDHVLVEVCTDLRTHISVSSAVANVTPNKYINK